MCSRCFIANVSLQKTWSCIIAEDLLITHAVMYHCRRLDHNTCGPGDAVSGATSYSWRRPNAAPIADAATPETADFTAPTASAYAFSKFYSNLLLIFGKLWEARSRLYRSRICKAHAICWLRLEYHPKKSKRNLAGKCFLQRFEALHNSTVGSRISQ